MRLECFQQRLEGGEPAIVGHLQLRETLGDPRQQCFLHLRLLLFDVQASLLRVNLSGQRGEQQDAQRSLLQTAQVCGELRGLG